MAIGNSGLLIAILHLYLMNDHFLTEFKRDLDPYVRNQRPVVSISYSVHTANQPRDHSLRPFGSSSKRIIEDLKRKLNFVRAI